MSAPETQKSQGNMEGSDEVDGRGGSPTGPGGKGWVDVLPGESKENRICVSMRRCVGGLAPAMCN